MRTLPEWIQPGIQFRDNDDLWHIRAIVDDMAVCRRWRASKKRWEYEVLDAIWFHVRASVLNNIA